jgi:hypothetical protein
MISEALKIVVVEYLNLLFPQALNIWRNLLKRHQELHSDLHVLVKKLERIRGW